jgi:hypothetical protein
MVNHIDHLAVLRNKLGLLPNGEVGVEHDLEQLVNKVGLDLLGLNARVGVFFLVYDVPQVIDERARTVLFLD